MTWRWRGLLKKEWILMRWQMIAFIVVSLLICFANLTPVLAGLKNFEHIDPQGLYDMMLRILLIIGPVLIVISIEYERKQLDVWLHSPASMFQVLGVKVLVAIIAVVVAMLFTSVLAGITYYYSAPENALPLSEAVWLTVKLGATAVVNAIFNTVAVLFVWILLGVIQLRIGNFAAFIILIPVLMMTTLWAVLTSIFPENAPLSVVGFITYALFSIVFFSAGSVLLDKKVRV